jgi:DNA-binding NarL/FixJ family response regulator
MTRVLLVDDHPLFRDGLEAWLRSNSDIEIVGQAGHIDEVRALADRVAIDLAVIDVWMAGGSGVAIAGELHARQPACRILGLSAVHEPSIIAEMLRAGASGFALKDDPPASLLEAIHRLASGERYLSPRISEDEVQQHLTAGATACDSRLTAREREILELVIRGYTNTEIGGRLFISRRTVETHRYRIAKKLNAHTIAEMQRAAMRSRP